MCGQIKIHRLDHQSNTNVSRNLRLEKRWISLYTGERSHSTPDHSECKSETRLTQYPVDQPIEQPTEVFRLRASIHMHIDECLSVSWLYAFNHAATRYSWTLQRRSFGPEENRGIVLSLLFDFCDTCWSHYRYTRSSVCASLLSYITLSTTTSNLKLVRSSKIEGEHLEVHMIRSNLQRSSILHEPLRRNSPSERGIEERVSAKNGETLERHQCTVTWDGLHFTQVSVV